MSSQSIDDNIVDGVDIDKLVLEVKADPERINDPSLSDDVIIALQKKFNPYTIIPEVTATPGSHKLAVCSHTNLKENYLQRLNMTALVGFMFQMSEEWEVPKEVRCWIPKSAPKDTLEPMDPTVLLAELAGITTYAEAMSTANNLKKVCDEKLLTEEHTPSLVEQSVAANEAVAATTYGVLHMLSKLGKRASDRLRDAATLAAKFPASREVVTKHPLPPPPSQLEIPAEVGKGIITNFLQHWLQFDPAIHVRAGNVTKNSVKKSGVVMSVAADDSSRLALDAIKVKTAGLDTETMRHYTTLTSDTRTRSAVSHIIRECDDNVITAMQVVLTNPVAWRSYILPPVALDVIIPPQDTFHRFRYYLEVNYEEIRTITEALYPERADLDWTLAIWEIIEGRSEAEAQEKFTQWCERHQDEVISDIRALDIGKWTMLADFKKNRDRIDFYNKHTSVLKKIMDRHGEDKKMGQELMRNRIIQGKAKNIQEAGPDAVGLATYMQQNAGGRSGLDKVISTEQMRRLEAANGNIHMAKELEQLDANREMLTRLKDIQRGRPLDTNEQTEFDMLTRQIKLGEEALTVPDGALQVDVFTHDAKSGTMKKSHIYTKAEDEDELRSRYREAEQSGAQAGISHQKE